MRWRHIIITSICLLVFLIVPSKPALGQNAPYPVYENNDKSVNYYYHKQLSAQETEGLLTAGSWLILAGLICLEPESLIVIKKMFTKAGSVVVNEKLFGFINRLL